MATERVYMNTTSEIEGNNSMGSADSISLTSGRSATISSSSDVDWFSFRVPSNGNYRFDISNIASESDYDIELFNSQNESFGSSSDVLSFETIIATLPAGQTFYLRVYSYGNPSTQKYYVTVTNDSCALLNWQYPYAGNNPARYVSSKYGTRVLNGQSDTHLGIDIVTGGTSGEIEGESIYNVSDGTVLDEGYDSSAGYYVAVSTEANSQIVAVFMHMQSSAMVSRNDWIHAGGHIGFTGNTGASFGSHLHLQVNNNGKVFNSKTGGLSVTNNPLRYYPNINFKNVTPGDITERSVRMEPEFKYPRELYSIKRELINYVGLSEFENFVVSMSNSDRQDQVYFTVMDFLNYFNIGGDEFKTLVEQYDLSSLYDVNVIIENL